MRATEFITEEQGLRLKHLADVKTNFPDADFWLQRKGSMDTIGKPTKQFSEENIGIKVTALDKIDSNWLYYVMMQLHNQGYFKQYAGGMLKLVHLPTDAVKNISFSPTNENYLNEYRKGPYRQVKQAMQHWPDYVIKDMIYKRISNSPDLKSHMGYVKEKAKDIEHWEFERGMMLNKNMLNPHTLRQMREREYGNKNPWKVPKDEERMINALDIVKQKGMENLPPIIMIKTPQGYELWEGWHRTMAAFTLHPGGFKVNAYIGYPTKEFYDKYYGTGGTQTQTNSYGRQYTQR